MLTRLRISIVLVAVVGVGCVGTATPAFADGFGNTDCAQNPTPTCELYAGNNPAPGAPSAPEAPKDAPRPQSETRGAAAAPKPICSYQRSNYQPPPGGAIAVALAGPAALSEAQVAPASLALAESAAESRAVLSTQAPNEDGAWYDWVCDQNQTQESFYRPPVWIPNGQAPGAVAVSPSPQELAERARRQLALPTPSIAASPAGVQLVNLPTWLWLSGGWEPVSATAAVPGVEVTASAAPTSVTWTMGDGTTVTCSGAGTAFRLGADPRAESPDCGHTYAASSAGQPGGAYAVTTTVKWTVTWAGAGQGGTFPDMTTTGAAGFQVAESQALNTGGN